MRWLVKWWRRRYRCHWEERELRRLIIHGVNRIMATQAELAAELQAVATQLNKIGGETSTLLQKITDLEAVIAAGPALSQDLIDAVAAVKTQAAVVDNLVPDAPTP